jgi:hypothetical protein
MKAPEVGSTWTKEGCLTRKVTRVPLKGDAPDTLRLYVEYKVNNTWATVTLESWNSWAKTATEVQDA